MQTKRIGLSVRRCAYQLDVSKEFIRRLCDSGELEFFHVGERRMIRVTTESWKNYLITLTSHLNVDLPSEEWEADID